MFAVRIDLTGHRYGRFTVLRFADMQGAKTRWLCRCDCGQLKTVQTSQLRNKIGTKSCGCTRKDGHRRHGMAGTKVYRIWSSMKERCLNPSHHAYASYGGRGISVCERWLVFEAFLADMGVPASGLSIDRVDNSGNYEPSNCRWATHSQQMNNTRRSRRKAHMEIGQ